MDATAAAAIVRAGEEAGLDIRISLNYSGRGMMGKTTAGVETESAADFLGAALRAVRDAAAADVTEGTETADDMIEAFERVRSDVMGRGYIYY
jgi:hypothetical protein